MTHPTLAKLLPWLKSLGNLRALQSVLVLSL